MMPGTYIVIDTTSGPRVCSVKGVVGDQAVLKTFDTGSELRYVNRAFFEHKRARMIPLVDHTDWIEVPSYLEQQAASNSMLEWAQTKFNERAYKRQQGIK